LSYEYKDIKHGIESINEGVLKEATYAEYQNSIVEEFQSLKDIGEQAYGAYVQKLEEGLESVASEYEDIKYDIRTLNDNISHIIRDDIRENASIIAEEMKTIFQKIDEDEKTDISFEIQDLKETVNSTMLELEGGLKDQFIRILNNLENVSYEYGNIKSDLEFINENVPQSINNNINENIARIVNEIKIVQEQLNDDARLYTSEDMQSDFARMRLVLHEISQAVENNSGENFGQLNSGLYDLSERIKNANENINRISDLINDMGLKEDSTEVIDNNFHNLRVEFRSIVDNFDKIGSDLSDISLRTNKLILTSEDSSKMLKSNLEDFRRIIEQSNPEKLTGSISSLASSFENSIRLMDNRFSEIMSRNNTLERFSSSNLKSVEDVKEALSYMAEWIDGAGSLLQDLKSDIAHLKIDKNSEIFSIQESSALMSQNLENLKAVSDDISHDRETVKNISSVVSQEIQNISGAISALEEKFHNLNQEIVIAPDNEFYSELSVKFEDSITSVKDSISNELAKISEKFESYDEKFKRLEDKLDAMQTSKTPELGGETKAILEFIAAQASAANHNSSASRELVNRISSLENKIFDFEENIDRLVKFVDEEV
jgi:predicted  nucleic acid-binding Zn-ribbon protein